MIKWKVFLCLLIISSTSELFCCRFSHFLFTKKKEEHERSCQASGQNYFLTKLFSSHSYFWPFHSTFQPTALDAKRQTGRQNKLSSWDATKMKLSRSKCESHAMPIIFFQSQKSENLIFLNVHLKAQQVQDKVFKNLIEKKNFSKLFCDTFFRIFLKMTRKRRCFAIT